MNKPDVTVKDDHDKIGEFLTIDADGSEKVRVICENGDFRGRIEEVPSDVPTQDHQSFEVVIINDVDESSGGGVVSIQVEKVTAMRIKCYCYGQEFVGENYDLEDCGSVESLVIFSE
jgi:hypothetical protein